MLGLFFLGHKANLSPMKIMNENYKKKKNSWGKLKLKTIFHFLISIFFTLNYISANTDIRQYQIGHLGQPKIANLEKIGIFYQLVDSAKCKVCFGVKCRYLWLDTVSSMFCNVLQYSVESHSVGCRLFRQFRNKRLFNFSCDELSLGAA